MKGDYEVNVIPPWDDADYTTKAEPRKTQAKTAGIFRSINENNKRRLDKLLGRKVALKLAPEDLAESLFEALRQGKAECVPSLLQAGADPNAVDEEGRTPLIALMEKSGNPSALRELIKAGANPNMMTYTLQQTALHIACKKGFQVAVKQLLAEGAKVNKADVHGYTPLIFAAKEGHVTAVKNLLREGADANKTNQNGEAAIHLAAKAGHGECVLELLEAHGSPNIRDARGLTPVYHACKTGNLDVVDLLMDYHCDVNCQDSNSGKTPLHWAIQLNKPKLVHKLLRMGADPNTRDNTWQTPFMIALSLGSRDMVQLLMRAGCDVNVTDRNFNQALHIAAKDGRSELIDILVEAGLDVNLKGAGGLTPLMLAAHGGHVNIVKTLLSLGANVHLTDRNKASALTFSIISDAEIPKINAIVKELIRANANLNETTNFQNLTEIYNIQLSPSLILEDRLHCPLELAYLRGKIATFMMLVAAGCELYQFKCNENQAMYDCKTHKSDFKNSLYLIRVVKKERKRLHSLKELCRGPALEALENKVPSAGKIMGLNVPDRVRRFLKFDDLDAIEKAYSVSLKDRRIASESTPGKSSELSFQRADRRRQTIQIGEKRTRPRSGAYESSTSMRTPAKVSQTASVRKDDATSLRRQATTGGVGLRRNLSQSTTAAPRTRTSSTSSNGSNGSYRPTTTVRGISGLTRSVSASAAPRSAVPNFTRPRQRSSLDPPRPAFERVTSSLSRSGSTRSSTERSTSSMTRSMSGQSARRAAPAYRPPSTSTSSSSSRSASPTPSWSNPATIRNRRSPSSLTPRQRNSSVRTNSSESLQSPRPLSPLPLEDDVGIEEHPAYTCNGVSDYNKAGYLSDAHPHPVPREESQFPLSPTDSGIEVDGICGVTDVANMKDSEEEKEPRRVSRIPVPTFQRKSSFRSDKSDMIDENGRSYFTRSRSVRKW